MPGFIGMADWEGRILRESFEAAVSTVERSRLARESLIDETGQWALARAHLGVLQPAPQLVTGQRVHVLLQGEITNAREIGSLVDVPAGDVPQAALVAGLYRAFGSRGLARLRGSYSVALLDLEQRQIVLSTDRVGSHPIYWATLGSQFLFASELRALIRLCGGRTTLNPRAIADYISLGVVTGNRTLAAGLELVGPGCLVTWGQESAVRIDCYAPTASFFGRREQSRQAYTANVVEAFGAAVRRASQPPGPLGMSLSGGLDSRAILSALEVPTRIHTYTLGIAGCADEAVAARLTTLTGSPHTFFELDARYLSGFLDHLRAMVILTDGMYLSHGLTEMLALGFLKSPGFTVLLRGHCGEMAKTRLAWPVHTDPTIFGLASRRELIDYLLRRMTFVSGGVEWLDLFTDDCRDQMIDGASTSLEESLSDVPLSPPEQCGYIFLHEYYRRMTIPSLELFRNAVEIRAPFADEEFLSVLLSGPPEWRDSTELHGAIIKRYNPVLLRVRDSNTGAALDAGPIRGALDDKLNTLLKRFNVPGYRHYHNFDEWMERMLIEAVESELLAPRSIDRGILRRDRTRALIDGARRGERGHAYLLQVLLILELWQQENLEEPPRT